MSCPSTVFKNLDPNHKLYWELHTLYQSRIFATQTEWMKIAFQIIVIHRPIWAKKQTTLYRILNYHDIMCTVSVISTVQPLLKCSSAKYLKMKYGNSITFNVLTWRNIKLSIILYHIKVISLSTEPYFSSLLQRVNHNETIT